MATLNNNKETFELLRGSPDSNSASELSEIVFPVKKKRYRRRLKNNPSTDHDETNTCQCKAKTFTLVLLCLVLICWLVTLTWLAFVFHGELNRLALQVSKVDENKAVHGSVEEVSPRVVIKRLKMSLNSMTQVNVPLQGGKKMKKRKELDALVAKSGHKRRDLEGGKRSSSAGGVSSHDKLLSDSTDEQDYWTSPAGTKPFRCHRRGYLVRKRTCSTFLKTCSAILVFTCVVATTTVMWLFVDVREQMTALRTELNQVVAGIQGVPDALQKCHTLSKDLQKNQSQIITRLSGFSFLLSNFSLEMEKFKSSLQTVQDQLRSSPDLINNPRLVKDLSASVATFGSQIRDLNSTVSTLKEQNGKLDALSGNLVSNVTEMKMKLTELSNAQLGKGVLTEKNLTAEKEAILAVVNQVSKNLSVINDTLSNKLQWTAQDQSKDHVLIENLREMNENVTARVKTLEGLCAKQPETRLFTAGQTVAQLSSPSSVNLESPSVKNSPTETSGKPNTNNPP